MRESFALFQVKYYVETLDFAELTLMRPHSDWYDDTFFQALLAQQIFAKITPIHEHR